jgi:hypothetical protein
MRRVADRSKIEAAGLIDVRRSPDGALLHIRLLDASTQTIHCPCRWVA